MLMLKFKGGGVKGAQREGVSEERFHLQMGKEWIFM